MYYANPKFLLEQLRFIHALDIIFLIVPAQLQVTPRFCQIVAAIPSLPSEIHPRKNIFEEDDNSNNIIKKKVYCMIYHVYDNSIQKIIIL